MSLFDKIVNSAEVKTEDAHKLRELGRIAAGKFVSEDRPLTDTVAELAKERGLSPDQVCRVVEAANVESFAHRFKQGFNTNIDFQVASVQEVMGILSPRVEKTASARMQIDLPRWSPAKAFAERHAKPVEKQAAKEKVSQAQIKVEIARLQQNIRKTEAMVSALEDKVKVAFIRLPAITKNHIRETGDPPWVIAAAVAAANPSKELAATVAGTLGDRVDFVGLEKKANYEQFAVDQTNPITGLVQDITLLLEKLVAANEYVQGARSAIEQLRSFLVGPQETSPVNEVFSDDGRARQAMAMQMQRSQMLQQQQMQQQQQQQEEQPQMQQ